jgi:tetratricopeptide (TPR) repeat protein
MRSLVAGGLILITGCSMNNRAAPAASKDQAAPLKTVRTSAGTTEAEKKVALGRLYSNALLETRDALAKQNFELALRRCESAEDIDVTAETRALRKEISDRKACRDYLHRGNEAMISKDYAEATTAYEAAAKLNPINDIEEKWRLARAYLKLEEAHKALDEGHLETAGQLAETSLWLHKTEEAESFRKGIPTSNRSK